MKKQEQRKLRKTENEKSDERKDTEKTRKKGLRGSYTVEAAAVVSFTFLVLAALILLTFFVHDRAVFQSAACEAAAVGSSFMTQEERSAAANETRESIQESRFLGSRGVEANVGVGDRSSLASWSAVYPLPGFAAGFFSNGSMNIKCSWSCKILDPADAIRKIRGAEMVLENLWE